MRKRVFVPIAAFCVIAIAAIMAFELFSIKSKSVTTLLDENIEALTQGETQGEGQNGYFVHHAKYYNPVTNLETNKCYAFCYGGPNGPCPSSHSHSASYCCTYNCY